MLIAMELHRQLQFFLSLWTALPLEMPNGSCQTQSRVFFAVELVRKAVDLRERRYVLSPILARRVWGAALKRSVFIACIWCLLVHTA